MITEIELPGVVGPDGLRLRTRDVPRLQAGQALVRMEATGVSFAEQQMRRGKYYDQPPFPFVPGYDVVGVVEALGDRNSGFVVGQRVASLTKVGGWANRLVLPTSELVPVPDAVSAEDAEAVIVNGVTARRMLAIGKVGRGDNVVVLGANGGVGSLLVQLAQHAGATAVGIVSKRHMQYVRDLGAIAIDRDSDTAAEVRAIAPGGVKAVFDHVGGEGIRTSWSMLGRGGVLVSYGTAATRDQDGNAKLPVLALIGQLLLWNALPNGRSATFFNIWAGRKFNPQRHQAALRADMEAVFGQVAAGVISARIARSFPLSDIADALRFAESGTAAGKVVLVPDQA
ncbi:medium chain dehydrogenase/reductase family protein [Kibdelosporangium phytohabitans]|uniref:NADPH:quinone reductase n=1 Tax=Kibdelosporangium phytohabitans TaxID=860235 RepID=A0A0N9I423_9PSEU|nr:medium chain dehydrogenase/reductase family protein [Kibdelosporangium phytohabitans]ALG10643.1 NADPH:quinone reductase [Kibdelosporangium phytohabitans]MBE1461763.1 NADPH:quinone reductase-like Zn-dependent oxidoreductase [Kibdelosporangium phytohabitans]